MPSKDFHESMVIRIFRYKYPIPFLKSSVFPKSTKQIQQQCKNQTGLFLFSGAQVVVSLVLCIALFLL